MAIVVKLLINSAQIIDGTPAPAGWTYLKSYDLEAHDGRGAVTYTNDRSKALRFATVGDFFKEYVRVPKNRRRRPDGKPNKPLSAFTVCTEEVDD